MGSAFFVTPKYNTLLKTENIVFFYLARKCNFVKSVLESIRFFCPERYPVKMLIVKLYPRSKTPCPVGPAAYTHSYFLGSKLDASK